MADLISVDKVYQTVLALANKEQRGYITPQEFNLFANQAQMDIFEDYFYDLNQFKRIPGNNSKYADVSDIIEEKISIFKTASSSITSDGYYYLNNIANLYRIINITMQTTPPRVMEEVNIEDWDIVQSSPLTRALLSTPKWYKDDGQLYFSHIPSGGITINYIRKPDEVKWAYTVVQGTPIYNGTNSVNFELHPSDEVELVVKILELAGIAIKDNSLYQIAAQEDVEDIQQEKR